MKLQSNNKMPLVTREGATSLICFNEKQTTIGEEKITMFEYDAFRTSFPHDYATIVAAGVRSRYTDDEVTAITINHLADPSEEHNAEFQALQDWRTQVKTIAKTIQ